MPRKEKKFHFIYRTTNIKTGKYYYGIHSTHNLDDGYLGSGKRLKYSINKYGKEAHEREILEFFENREDLRKREKDIVNLNEIAKAECMNLQLGGGGGFIDVNHQRKCGAAGNKAYANRLKNDIAFLESRKKISSDIFIKLHKEGKIKPFDWTGKTHSDKTKKKISESAKSSHLGYKNSQFGTCWIHNNIESKKIKKEELDNYIKLGWIQGRKLKFN